MPTLCSVGPPSDKTLTLVSPRGIEVAQLVGMSSRAYSPKGLSPGATQSITVEPYRGQRLYADRIYMSGEVGDSFTVETVIFDRVYEYPHPGTRIVDVAGRPQHEIICHRRDEIDLFRTWEMRVTNHTQERRHFVASLALTEHPRDDPRVSNLMECYDQAKAKIAEWERAHATVHGKLRDNVEHLRDVLRRERDTLDRMQQLEQQLLRCGVEPLGQGAPPAKLDELSYGGTVLDYQERFGK